MNDALVDDDARRQPQKTAPWWQFSLREILLATTAVAALLALAIKSYPASPTPFFHAFDAQREIEGVLRANGIPITSSGTSGSSSYGGKVGRKKWVYQGRQSQQPLGAIGHAFAQRVEAELERHGCTIEGRRTSGVPQRKLVTGFGYSYRRGATHGEFAAELIERGEGSFSVHVFCFEFTTR